MEPSAAPHVSTSRRVLSALSRPLQRLLGQQRASSSVATTAPVPDRDLWRRPSSGSTTGLLSTWDQSAALGAFTGHVYTATRAIATRVPSALASLVLVAQDRVTGDEKEFPDHPAIAAMRHPNAFMDGDALLQLTSISLDLAGNYYWVKLREGGPGTRTKIEGYFPLLPHWTRIVAGREAGKLIEGYNFYPGGAGLGTGSGAIVFAPEDIVHFKRPNPEEHWYGWPTLRAALYEREAHESARRYRAAWFRNQARPDYVIGAKVAPGDAGKAQMAAIWEMVLQHHQGAERFGLPLVLPLDDIKLEQLGFSMEQSGFVGVANLTKEDIFEIFGVNRYAAGSFLDVGSRAQADAAEVQFARATVKPRCDEIVSAIERQVVAVEGYVSPEAESRVRLFLRYEDPVPADRESDHKELMEMLAAGALSRDEVREAKGWEPYEPDPKRPGSMIFVPFGLVPLDLAESAAVGRIGAGQSEGEPAPETDPDMEEPDPDAEDEAEDAAEDEPKHHAPARARHRKARLPLPLHAAKVVNLDTEEKREAHWKRQLPRLEAHEKRTARVAATFFRRQAKRVLPGIEAHIAAQIARFAGVGRRKVRKTLLGEIHKGAGVAGFDEDFEDEAAAKAFLATVKATYKAGGEQALSQFGIDFDVQNPRAIEWLNNHSLKLGKDINKTTWPLLAKAIADGVTEGESVGQIMTRLRGVYTSMEPYRAARIARTETTTAFNRGTLDSFREPGMEGIVERKQWVSARDEHVRRPPESEFDHWLDGEERELDEAFSNGLQFPGDPAGEVGNLVNCRCVVSAVVAGE